MKESSISTKSRPPEEICRVMERARIAQPQSARDCAPKFTQMESDGSPARQNTAEKNAPEKAPAQGTSESSRASFTVESGSARSALMPTDSAMVAPIIMPISETCTPAAGLCPGALPCDIHRSIMICTQAMRETISTMRPAKFTT